jgi:hypothetical protein
MTPPSAKDAAAHYFLTQDPGKQDITNNATFLNYVLPSACYGTQTSPSVPVVVDNISYE